MAESLFGISLIQFKNTYQVPELRIQISNPKQLVSTVYWTEIFNYNVITKLILTWCRNLITI